MKVTDEQVNDYGSQFDLEKLSEEIKELRLDITKNKDLLVSKLKSMSKESVTQLMKEIEIYYDTERFFHERLNQESKEEPHTDLIKFAHEFSHKLESLQSEENNLVYDDKYRSRLTVDFYDLVRVQLFRIVNAKKIDIDSIEFSIHVIKSSISFMNRDTNKPLVNSSTLRNIEKLTELTADYKKELLK